ncbi:uncharacterized protein DUF4386 [Oryzihumus leptocrescens]|uniref:Uncharacterized protein DUF4386 n=1 Tax=Oryzihumus leptocrescens TaxID=297536 RepID=A0A542ZHS8_9MICO|nr:uncharacterized protein DUF4386 [Oryzihumus leptocrescens]
MTDRVIARTVGALFIVGTVTAVVGGSMVLAIEDPGALSAVAGDQGRVATGVLLELVLALSVLGIGALLFPVLRRRDEGLALAYAGVRTLEAVFLMAASVAALVFLASGPGAPAAGGAGRAPALVLALREWTYLIGSMVLLGAGGLILYSLLFRAALVPTWLSLWGLVAAVLILLRGVLEVYGLDLSVVWQAALAAPIAVNEMVLAVWLIVRGFDAAGARASRVLRR